MKRIWTLVGVLLWTFAPLSALAQGSIYRSSPPEDLYFHGVLSYSADDELILQYVLRNDGSNPIIADPTRLAVLYAAEPIAIDVVRVPPPGLLNQLSSGETEYGTVIIRDAPFDSDNLEFFWQLTEIGPNTHYALSRRFIEMDEQPPVSVSSQTNRPAWIMKRGE